MTVRHNGIRPVQRVYWEALKAPATASDNGPGEWPHLDERHDSMKNSAAPRRVGA